MHTTAGTLTSGWSGGFDYVRSVVSRPQKSPKEGTRRPQSLRPEPSPGAMTGAAVEVDGLVIRYGDVVAVSGATFHASGGEVTVLLGPNGAGKTSTIEHLEGFRRADAGRAQVLGLDPVADHRLLSARVGIMLQDGGIPMAIRPLEVLEQYAGFFADSLDPAEVLRRVGLDSLRKSTYRKLSGGEKQRLSLGLAIIGRPEVVFLDEPSAGVDLVGRDVIGEIIGELRADGVCVVVTTHDLNEAERLADHVVIIDHGSVVAEGSLEEILTSGTDDAVTFATAQPLDVEALGAVVGQPVERSGDSTYRVGAPGAAGSTRLISAIASWCADNEVDLVEVRAGRSTLDTVFRRLTGPSVDRTASPQREVVVR